jgi:hypothetical protein
MEHPVADLGHIAQAFGDQSQKLATIDTVQTGGPPA